MVVDLTKTLRITEIFHSLQGESSTVGWPTVFVRLTGCPLRCVYCDTAYAFSGGQKQTLAQICETVMSYGAQYVTVTGGEPLAQRACLDLLVALCDQGLHVSLETGGMMDISAVDPRVMKVVDIKTPGSGEVQKNRLENLAHLGPEDQLKFVICSRDDFDWAHDFVLEYDCCNLGAGVLFSPSADQVPPADLAKWILDAAIPVRFQLQLHKILWGDQPGV